jgi:hypothetical protein
MKNAKTQFWHSFTEIIVVLRQNYFNYDDQCFSDLVQKW